MSESHDPFDPDYNHKLCYFWCGNPYCDSAPDNNHDAEVDEEY